MATINIHELKTINKAESGVYQSVSCPAITIDAGMVLTAGDPCNYSSGTVFKDDNNNCFECNGYSSTEVKILKKNTTTVYIKSAVTLNLNYSGAGNYTSGISDFNVYFGSDGTTSRNYGAFDDGDGLPSPTRSGYTFNGWFTASSGGTQRTNASAVPDSVGIAHTLYAQWTASQTDAPSISAGIYLFNQWEIQVTNNDSSTATIYAEENDSTPDINRGSVASGSYVSVYSSQPSFATFTMYATAQASGETLSNVVSRTIT